MLLKNICLAVVAVILVGSLMMPVISDAAEDSVVDVIIVDGQSNAEDWGSFSTTINSLYTEAPSRTIYYYGTPTATTHYNDASGTTYGLQPMYKSNSWVIGGYGPALCTEYAEKNHHDICYINIGYSGQSITTLMPNGSVGTWGFKIVGDALQALEPKYDKINMIGWIWAQGEADASMTVSTYVADFEVVQAKFAEFGAKHCYIIHTREYYGGNATEAQAQIAATDPNVTMTCEFTEDFTAAAGEVFSDGPIHYTQKGRLIIAEELAKVIPTNAGGAEFSLYLVIPAVMIMAIVVAVATTFIKNRD